MSKQDGFHRQTDRLHLRSWRDEDLEGLTAMNADPKVMEHFPIPLTASESASFLQRLKKHEQDHGFTVWAVGTDEAPFIGFCGGLWTDPEYSFAPAIELIWRFRCEFWGQGYASEAAKAAIKDVFTYRKIDSLVAFTAETNVRSWKLMERLRMRRNEDFAHPKLPKNSPLSLHRLYRMNAKDWRKINQRQP